MAETLLDAQKQGIKNAWSFMNFIEGKDVDYAPFSATDAETGEVRNYHSLVLTKRENGERQFVNFSSVMGELSPEELMKEKDTLRVVELESGSFKLCRPGENAWVRLEF